MANESAFMTWFRAEFLTPRRLLFNVLWYGTHIGVFAYGWYSQVWKPSFRSQLRNQDVFQPQASNQRLAALNGLRFSVWTSRGAGRSFNSSA